MIPENVRLQTLTATVPATMLPGTAAAPRRRRRCDEHRRHVRRANLQAPGRGRVHDAARPHPAAHQHPAHDVDGTAARRRRTTDDHRHASPSRRRCGRITTPPPATTLQRRWRHEGPRQGDLHHHRRRRRSSSSSPGTSSSSARSARAERPGPADAVARRRRWSTAQQEVVRLESYKKTAPQSRAEIVRLGKMLPDERGHPVAHHRAHARPPTPPGVVLTSITRGTTTPGTPVRHPGVTLQVSGRFFDVEDFLYRLENYVAFRNASFRVTGRLLQVASAHPAGGDRPPTSTGGSPPLAVTIVLNAYLWGGVAQAAPAAAARGRCAMSQNRRTLTYVAIALIVGAALALAVALASSGADASGVSRVGRRRRRRTPRIYSDDAGTTALAAADPAKEQPLLDKFTSKDPFIPLPTPGATATATREPQSDEHVERRPTCRRRSRSTARTTRWSRATRCPAARRRVHDHGRHVGRRHLRGHRRRARERRHSRSPSTSASPSA